MGNILYKSHFNIGKSFKFKINPKQGMPKTMVVSLTTSIIVSASVIGIYEITKHDFSNVSNLSAKSNSLDNINISISDTSKITNTPVLVDIQVKDKSLVKDLYIKLGNSEKFLGSYVNQSTYRFKITKNGYYTVFVNFKQQSPLVKEFKINCIDTESPNIINYKYDSDKIIISLKDSSSEIDFNNIYLKDSNGRILNIQSIDKDKGIIVVKIINLPLYLTIYDIVGNKAVYNIKKV
ncbi:hypothetical protein QJS64_20135 (plasmid) [Paraclostridium bifermentans]|uniref:Uncharacterized protein n=1 Tax=Paraclostridium bifermentans TaxID=1490 RepID=A0ABY8R7I3_PARBF|nr:hypothetical protein QJS64_20135 [Paraclostridium bifermentans]